MRKTALSGAWLVLALLVVAGALPAQAQKPAPAPQVLPGVPVTVPGVGNLDAPKVALVQVQKLHLQVAQAASAALQTADKPHRLRAERLLQEIPRRLATAEAKMDLDPKGAAIQIREALKAIEKVQKHLNIELPKPEAEVKP